MVPFNEVLFLPDPMPYAWYKPFNEVYGMRNLDANHCSLLLAGKVHDCIICGEYLKPRCIF